MKVELHPEADEEFTARLEFYESQEPGLGQRFYREVIGCLEWISENPTVPRMRRDHRRVNLKVFPFYIAYVVEGALSGSWLWRTAIANPDTGPHG